MDERDIRHGCCGMDPELERELLALLREGKRPVEIIKRLQEATGVSIQHCIRWVDEHMPGPRKPCPYCQAPLASSEAKQCFSCGYDWHNPHHVVHRGNPNCSNLGFREQ